MLNKPRIIVGNSFQDQRGTLNFNNDFNLEAIKRIYTIEHNSVDFYRGWQGHKIEQRWITAVKGSFKIWVNSFEGIENINHLNKPFHFELTANNLDVLYVPSGFLTCFKAEETESKLLLFSDYLLGELQDEWRFENTLPLE